MERPGARWPPALGALVVSARAFLRALGAGIALLSLPQCMESEQVLFPQDAGGGAESQAGGGPSPMAGTGAFTGSGGAGSSPRPGPTGERVEVNAGDAHTCATVDGALYCWGNGAAGELGLGDFAARLAATRVGEELGWSQPGAGDTFSCALLEGQPHCWGRGSNGQIGNGSFSETATPTRVSTEDVAVLSVGHDHACAVLDSGALECWGNNTEGQLGLGDPFPSPGLSRAEPSRVGSANDWLTVSTGQGHSCGIREPGRLYCWGRNGRGELGLGDAASLQIRTPQRVDQNEDWRQVAAGQNHSCGIRDAALWCWGDDSHDQAGVAGAELSRSPVAVELGASVVQVSLDTFHTCARLDSGEVLCFGRNREGQLGLPQAEDALGPTPLEPGPWEAVSVGRFHTCGVQSSAIFCAGLNSEGRLGVGDTERRSSMSATLAFF